MWRKRAIGSAHCTSTHISIDAVATAHASVPTALTNANQMLASHASGDPLVSTPGFSLRIAASHNSCNSGGRPKKPPRRRRNQWHPHRRNIMSRYRYTPPLSIHIRDELRLEVSDTSESTGPPLAACSNRWPRLKLRPRHGAVLALASALAAHSGLLVRSAVGPPAPLPTPLPSAPPSLVTSPSSRLPEEIRM